MPSALSLRVVTQNSWSSAALHDTKCHASQQKTTNFVSWASPAPRRAVESGDRSKKPKITCACGALSALSCPFLLRKDPVMIH